MDAKVKIQIGFNEAGKAEVEFMENVSVKEFSSVELMLIRAWRVHLAQRSNKRKKVEDATGK